MYIGDCAKGMYRGVYQISSEIIRHFLIEANSGSLNPQCYAFMYNAVGALSLVTTVYKLQAHALPSWTSTVTLPCDIYIYIPTCVCMVVVCMEFVYLYVIMLLKWMILPYLVNQNHDLSRELVHIAQ